MMEWDKDISFTYGDIVWNLIDPNGNVIPHLMMCTSKDALNPGQTDLKYWTAYESSMIRNRVRNKELYDKNDNLDASAVNNILKSDRILSSDALSSLISFFMGEGYNSKGELEYLSPGSNLNNIKKSSKFRLHPNATYPNLPKVFKIEDGDFHSYAVVETTLVGGVELYQSVLYFRNDDNTIEAYYRYTNTAGGWNNWLSTNLTSLTEATRNYINETMMEYYNSLKTLSEVSSRLKDSVAKLVFSDEIRSDAYSKINIHYYDPGSYQVFIIKDKVQRSYTFTSEDIQYAKLNPESGVQVILEEGKLSIIKESQRVKLHITESYPYSVKILRTPIVTL